MRLEELEPSNGHMEEDTRVYQLKDKFLELDYKAVLAIFENLPGLCSSNDRTGLERAVEKFQQILDQYQEQPHLLDEKVESMVAQLLDMSRQADPLLEDHSYKLLCHLFKVRGVKVSMRLMPHEVTDLEPVVTKLENLPTGSSSETHYILLLWLAVLCKIPFGLSKFDRINGVGVNEKAVSDDKSEVSMIRRIMAVANAYLSLSDRSQRAAAMVLANLLTRPDTVTYLDSELDLLLEPFSNERVKKELLDVQAQAMLSGNLLVLSYIFKLADRNSLISRITKVVEPLLGCEYLRVADNILLRKLYCKVIQRAALIYLPRRVADWRYDRGARTLSQNLATSNPQASGDANRDARADSEYEDVEVSPLVETILAQLLEILTDKDTVVRWSASKGVGRIVNCLNAHLADQVVSWVTALLTPGESEASWHGGCLALAELSRRGLLLPSRLPEVIPRVEQAFAFDEIRGRHSVGDNVRDAACYVAWAFARAYSADALKPFVRQIATSLVAMALFDREIICRRAASAAFQEHVGRQGNFPSGIEVLTIIDYFNVGLRRNCYGELCVKVAQFPDYTQVLIDQLLEKKILHWDEDIRELAGAAFGMLAKTAPQIMTSTALPKLVEYAYSENLFARHGATIALGSLVESLNNISSEVGDNITDYVDGTIVTKIVNLPQFLQSKGFIRGLGADMMRRALNHFFEAVGPANLIPPSQSTKEVWLKILYENLCYTEDATRAGACSAFGKFCVLLKADKNRFEVTETLRAGLQNARNLFECMGFANGLGALPLFMFSRSLLISSLGTMSNYVRCPGAKDAKWAEPRRDCVTAISNILETLRTSPAEERGDNTMTPVELRDLILNTYLTGLRDYTIDNRGDVGRLVREASMTALIKFVLGNHSVADTKGREPVAAKTVQSIPVKQILDDKMCKDIISQLLRQACGPIDGTRDVAATALTKILHGDNGSVLLPCVAHVDILKRTFAPIDPTEGSWKSSSLAFARLAALLDAEQYLPAVLLGFVISAGNLTESVMRHASTALLTWLAGVQHDLDKLQTLLATFCDLYREHYRIARVTTPIMKVISMVLTTGYLEAFVEERGADGVVYDLLDLTLQETKGSKFVGRRILGLTLCADMLQFDGKAARRALQALLLALVDRDTPRVRKLAAEKLYESILTYAPPVIPLDNHSEHVMMMLDSTNWFGDLEELKGVQQELARVIGVELDQELS